MAATLYFNPTRVRLKLCVSASSTRLSTLQPHKGASETACRHAHLVEFSDFNPTRVRLKRESHSGLCPATIHFNPTRVRLKRDPPVSTRAAAVLLQPHKGASETCSSASAIVRLTNFNPTRVRLKHFLFLESTALGQTSTPQGCV